jgi:hypothetical protein
MILLLMRDDKVDDQRVFFFLHFCSSNYIFFFTLSASRCLRDGQRFTFNLGSSILIEHFGGYSVLHRICILMLLFLG